MEKIAVYTGLFIIVLLLVYQILIIIGLAPGIPCCGGIPCITVIIGMGVVLSTYAAYRFGGKNDPKKSERLQRSFDSSVRSLKFTIILRLAAMSIAVLAIGCIVVVGLYFQYHNPASGSHGAGVISPAPAGAASGIPPTMPAATPRNNIGPLIVDQDKLKQTDPIVAIWQSTDASIKNVPSQCNNYILIIYNDNTYAIYDKINHTHIEGTWEKMPDNGAHSEYTVHEDGAADSPSTKMTYSASSLQYVYTYEDNPPHSVISYINYRILDYYPLTPSTQAYIEDLQDMKL